MEEIGHGCEHSIPKWVKKVERRNRSRLATYHGIPYNTTVEFKGKKFIYEVVYGDALEMGISPTITFHREKRIKQHKHNHKSSKNLFSKFFG